VRGLPSRRDRDRDRRGWFPVFHLDHPGSTDLLTVGFVAALNVVAGLYRAAQRSTLVGGDFFDVRTTSRCWCSSRERGTPLTAERTGFPRARERYPHRKERTPHAGAPRFPDARRASTVTW
jgi:hypothetical protein